MSKRWERFVVIYMLALVVLSGMPLQAYSFHDYPHLGPFVEKIVYNVILDEDERIQALLDNDIDLIGDTINPFYLDQLEESENIEIAVRLQNGYDILNINCAKYPFNISSFRRALAFALNKTGICSDEWSGYATPQDCPISSPNPFSAEGLLDFTYYEANPAMGNLLLDEAGFVDVDDDGFREAPDGSDFDVLIEVSLSREGYIEIGQFVQEALEALSIDAEAVVTDYMEYTVRFPYRGDYDMFVQTEEFTNFDIEWFAYEYWTEYVNEPYRNFPNWQNTTFDSWRSQLLNATDFDSVLQAAIEMQRIWVYDCPAIICYQNTILSAYRTDKFEGFVNSVQSGVSGWWTNYKVNLNEDAGGPYGGVLRWSNTLDMDTTNFMVSSSPNTANVLQMLYDSLLRQDPDGNDLLWLAESYFIETNDDNSSVPDGHTRFTFDIRQNVTWTDGIPLTGEDVAFSLNYYRDAPGNPIGVSLASMTTAYAQLPYRVIIEFSTESFWHLHTIGYKPIIPKHIFEEIGVNGWNTWIPDPPAIEMVTSGPFNISDYVPGEFVELTYFPNYMFESLYIPATLVEPITSPSPIFPIIDIPGTPFSLSTVDLLITIPSIVVIVVVLFKWMKERKN